MGTSVVACVALLATATVAHAATFVVGSDADLLTAPDVELFGAVAVGGDWARCSRMGQASAIQTSHRRGGRLLHKGFAREDAVFPDRVIPN